MQEFQSVLEQALERVSPYRLGLAFGLILGSLVLRWVLAHMFERYVSKLTQLSKTDLDDEFVQAISRPVGSAALLLGLFMAVQSLQPPPKLLEWLDTFFAVAVGALLTWVMLRLVNVLTHALQNWARRTETALDDQLVPLISRAAKVTVGVLAALLILQNMGFAIGGLVAGLGVGGLAVALAAQKAIGDLFGSIMLLIDRPFMLGDWVKSPDGQIEGVVERIGFRSTRIRTFEKTLITVPNSRLADFIVDNMNLRPIRRVWITLGLTYGTTAAQMGDAVGGIEKLIQSHPEVDQDFYLVNFTDFGSSSLDIMVYYFTSTIVWKDYLRIREEVNLQIMNLLEGMGLSIAFPTRTLHMEWGEGRGPVPPSEPGG